MWVFYCLIIFLRFCCDWAFVVNYVLSGKIFTWKIWPVSTCWQIPGLQVGYPLVLGFPCFHISGPNISYIWSNQYNWGYFVVLWFPLKVAFIFWDLLFSVYAVTIETGVNYSFMISYKSGFHISGPSMSYICSNQYNWGKTVV